MYFTLERVTPPDGEPVDLASMKRHLRTFTSATDEDADITAHITAAREWVEDYTGRALLDQTWKLTLQGRPGSFAGGDIVGGTRDGRLPPGYGYYFGLWMWSRSGEIMLRKAPVISITSFVTVDQAGVETAVDPATYQLREANSKWPRVVALNGSTWSTWLTGDMRITFRAGYADEDTIPIRFKQAIKLHAEANYDRDQGMMQKLLDAAEALIRPERSELQVA
jgi:hypothetical protein